MQILTQKSLFLMLSLALIASPAMAEEHFHVARSEAEHALEDIIWRSDYDRGLLDYVFADANRKPKRDVDYAKNVTKGFRASVIAFEKTLEKDTCIGTFRSGRICGYDANPFTCRQDVGKYLYATQKKTKPAVTISVNWEDQLIQDQKVQYRLVKEKNVWKIDGVLCHEGPNFNYKKK